MADGRIQRIDEKAGLAYVIMRGRTYAAPLAEVETKARVPSARVRFDLVRRHGTETATNVRLRRGSRTNRRQRRFGDLTGARRPGAKSDTIAARLHGVDVTTQPFRVASAWVEAMADQDYDGATSLYLSGSTLHTPQDTGSGRRHIRTELERSDLVGIDLDDVDIHGFDRYVAVDFDDRGGPHTTYLRIEQGHIVEQWIDVEPMQEAEEGTADELPAIEYVCRGTVPSDAETYAEGRFETFVEHLHQSPRSVRVKLTAAQNPRIDRPAMAEATVELDKYLLRAHSTEPTFTEAVDQVVSRLSAQVESHRDRERHKPTGLEPSPGTWRHGNLSRPATPYFDRPAGEREIVRHKSFAADELTIDEAAWDMGLLDYDFFLFVELASGDDTLIERQDDGSLLVHQLDPEAEMAGPTATAHTMSTSPPPELAVSGAVDLLNESGDPLLFFQNRSSGRGNVVYRRYDGHYGLITPPTDET